MRTLRDAHLFVVGSLRYVDAEKQRYLTELHELAAKVSNVHIVESFVSNEDFDTWITASDWVVFPYTEIWSSGVLGRTKLLERPCDYRLCRRPARPGRRARHTVQDRCRTGGGISDRGM